MRVGCHAAEYTIRTALDMYCWTIKQYCLVLRSWCYVWMVFLGALGFESATATRIFRFLGRGIEHGAQKPGFASCCHSLCLANHMLENTFACTPALSPRERDAPACTSTTVKTGRCPQASPESLQSNLLGSLCQIAARPPAGQPRSTTRNSIRCPPSRLLV